MVGDRRRRPSLWGPGVKGVLVLKVVDSVARPD